MDTVLTFLSMMNQRKRSHNEFSMQIRDEFEGVLSCEIPNLTLVERMGIERQPLPAFTPISAAANAYYNLWNEVQERIF